MLWDKTLLICPDLSGDCEGEGWLETREKRHGMERYESVMQLGCWPHQLVQFIKEIQQSCYSTRYNYTTAPSWLSVHQTHPYHLSTHLDKKAFFLQKFQLHPCLIKRPILLFTWKLSVVEISHASEDCFMSFFAFFCAEVRFEQIFGQAENIGQSVGR